MNSWHTVCDVLRALSSICSLLHLNTLCPYNGRMTNATFNKLAVIVVLIGLVARLPLLDGSLWLDEAAQAIESARPLHQQFDIIADFQPPLLHLLLHIVQRVSHQEAWMRLWGALIPGILTLILTLSVARKVFSDRVALFATLLLSISSFHVYFSQELRPYALPAFFAALSWWLLLTVFDTKKRHQKVLLFTLYGISTWLGLFASYLYPFLLIGQVVYVCITHKKYFGPYFLTVLATSVAYLPWLPTFFMQLAAGRQVQVDLPGWSEVVSIPQLKSIPLTIGKFIYGVLYIDPTIFFIGTGLLITITTSFLIYWYLLKNQTKLFTKKTWLLISWFAVPLFTAWVVSFFVPVVHPKRMLITQPAFYIGFAFLIEWGIQQKKKSHNKTALLLALTLSIVSLVSLQNYYSNPKLQRENWRSLHTEILHKYPKNSIVVFSFTNPFAPWEWYDSGDYPTFSTGALTISAAPNLLERSKVLTQYDYILVFDHLRTLTDPTDMLLDIVKDFGYSQVELIEYPHIGFVRVFAKHEATISKLPVHTILN